MQWDLSQNLGSNESPSGSNSEGARQPSLIYCAGKLDIEPLESPTVSSSL
eukprot:jgi/Botrbrau1/14819/Bobra.168_3s0001.1